MWYVDFEAGCQAHELKFAQTDSPVLAAGKVLVDVKAFGINRADTLQRQGKYPAPAGESPILGLEVSGIVTQVADDVKAFKPGDRVFGLVAGGGYSQCVCVDARHLMAIPDTLDFTQAAGIAEVFLTAYQSLFYLGNLAATQKLLIHAGASGVGLAAIQLASFVGAQVAVTASSAEKLAVCAEQGAGLSINYQQQDFVAEIKQNWGGVDLVVDFVGGDYVSRNLKLLNTDGTMVYQAMLAGRYAQLDMALLLAKRASIKGSTLRNRSDDYKAQLIQDFRRDFLAEFATGKLRANILHVFAAGEVGQAHQMLEQNLSKGKLICKW